LAFKKGHKKKAGNSLTIRMTNRIMVSWLKYDKAHSINVYLVGRVNRLAIDYLVVSTAIFLAIMITLLLFGKKRQLSLSLTQQAVLIGCGLLLVWFFPYLVNRFQVWYVAMFYLLISLGVAWALGENRLKEAGEQPGIAEQVQPLSHFDLQAEVAAVDEASVCSGAVTVGEESRVGDKMEKNLAEEVTDGAKAFAEPEGTALSPAVNDGRVDNDQEIYDDEPAIGGKEADGEEEREEYEIILEPGFNSMSPVRQDDDENNNWDDAGQEIRHNINKNEMNKNDTKLSAGENNREGILLRSSEERGCEKEEEDTALLDVETLIINGFDAKSAGDLSQAVVCFLKVLELSEEPELISLVIEDVVHMCLETGDYRTAIGALRTLVDKGVSNREGLDFYREMRRLEFIEEELAARGMAGLPYRQVPRLIRLRVEEKLDRLDTAKLGEGSSTWR